MYRNKYVEKLINYVEFRKKILNLNIKSNKLIYLILLGLHLKGN